MNRFLLKGLASVLTMAVMFGTVSCSDDDDKPDGSVAVSAVAVSPTTATIKVGERYYERHVSQCRLPETSWHVR